MKFEIHYDIGEHHDYFIIEGDTISEIKEAAFSETESRGLTQENNNLYSIQIED